ncbi:hypothetical protein BCR33DRAFT_710910 [Rhizoclosmatium globosum]|uniref:G-protein coupled receptors family 3 profile domain-containing protein n=1 Tax=Rhizoclosmatium globosum TaxID=329046 RepID=A0A1Y2D2G8_9FUNG|nr:hypothetical protein BCR33DRAFT_710910 [Rhizoclosmatium globosum]|eukprot:ORY53493.1 hypothetical protein BCR33DRAFT_710910 [Rhizoclosmatium globosum]
MLILPSIILCSIATSLSLFLMFYIIYFIVVHEFLLVSKDFSLKAMASLFHVLIITGNFSSAGFSITMEVDSPLQKAMGVIAGFTVALSEYCYLRYTWARGSDIVRRQFKFAFSGMSLFVKLMPIPLITECVATALHTLEPDSTVYTLIYFGIHSVLGAVIIAFDSIMLSSFIQCLRNTHMEEEAASKDLLMISWYGIGSTLLCFAMIAVFVGAGIVVSLEVSNFLFSVIAVLMSLVFFMLTMMKIRIIHQSRGSTAQSISISITKQVSSRTYNGP